MYILGAPAVCIIGYVCLYWYNVTHGERWSVISTPTPPTAQEKFAAAAAAAEIRAQNEQRAEHNKHVLAQWLIENPQKHETEKNVITLPAPVYPTNPRPTARRTPRPTQDWKNHLSGR